MAGYNRLKHHNVSRLDAELSDVPGIAIARPSREAVRGGFYQGYPIQLLDDRVSRATVLHTLQAKGIDAAPYPFPLHHRLRVYTDSAYRHQMLTGSATAPTSRPQVSLPVTERLADRLILLAPRYLLTLNQATLNTLRAILSTL